jgi:urease subunit beta/urease subunit gamma/beta
MVKPGEWILSDQPVEINAGRRTVRLRVHNTGDRPIQVGSHFHFFEVNRAMDFDRPRTMGMHLNIPAGTSIRFEPGDEKEVELVEFGGMKRVVGFNGLVNGSVQATWTVKEALQRARNLEFGGMGHLEQEEVSIVNRRTKERQGKERET